MPLLIYMIYDGLATVNTFDTPITTIIPKRVRHALYTFHASVMLCKHTDDGMLHTPVHGIYTLVFVYAQQIGSTMLMGVGLLIRCVVHACHRRF